MTNPSHRPPCPRLGTGVLFLTEETHCSGLTFCSSCRPIPPASARNARPHAFIPLFSREGNLLFLLFSEVPDSPSASRKFPAARLLLRSPGPTPPFSPVFTL